MKLERQLTLKNGIPLGIGSIIGSGILFLPSLTYSISGQKCWLCLDYFYPTLLSFACNVY